MSRVGPTLTALATGLILAMLALILGHVTVHGWSVVTWGFLSGGAEEGLFTVGRSGIFPMLFGTAARVILMTLLVIPAGVITAVYLNEYAPASGRLTRWVRGAVNHLAGVPSIVFGLFGLGFFIGFVGAGLDDWLRPGAVQPYWAGEGLLWASATLAVMTLPVVVVATEEALRAVPAGLREASLALGATRLQTIIRIVLPHSLSGILTGSILAIGRAAGEVVPLLFTGAALYVSRLPGSLNDKFMDLAYHVWVLCTQSPDIDQTKPLLYGTVLVLLGLTLSLNLVAVVIRARISRNPQATP
ncbi:MAG: phosphate ABC transporter permease PstA [Verrucomicrobia bacterium]|nr:phosphate ABC transporter permease PstA [Verrucomicrobiota bacterium]